MCLIITVICAAVFSAVYLLNKKEGRENKSVFLTMLMFWAAGLMWSMDGVASVLEGEGFFDLSLEDSILGLIIAFTGFLVFTVHALWTKHRKVF